MHFNILDFNNRPHIYFCEPNWQWAPPPLPDHDLWIVLDGRGRLKVNDIEYRLEAGHMFLLAPGSRIAASHNPQRRLRVFAVHLQLEPEDLPMQHRVDADINYLNVLTRHCCMAFRKGAMAESRLIVEILLTRLLTSLPDVGERVDFPLVRLLDSIDEDPGQAWDIDRMRRKVHLSVPQLVRRFRAAAGVSPVRYVIQARIARAKILLNETKLTISEIATNLGYRDVSYFSRQFKDETGMSPLAFRRQNSP